MHPYTLSLYLFLSLSLSLYLISFALRVCVCETLNGERGSQELWVGSTPYVGSDSLLGLGFFLIKLLDFVRLGFEALSTAQTYSAICPLNISPTDPIQKVG